ncbi:uncharacterized protein DUF421 [Hasllibacter halocynthiae]|uniref:Uncharacterized protein DUF421 n=1 Tax=Hasllibacter halocynthiae TaxID=595589 RepID=A0A2T0X4D9_9RHOB|nr:YetF domain-containing protein [Hasllibacter halocynthiae]PRY93808.1 uncharacterized protein DUF421 [Hasllibacter halocynthiae]
MENVTPFDLHRMFIGDEPPLYFAEIAFRTVAVYAFAVVALRYMGSRGNRGFSPFENVVIIALGSAAGDTMFYPQVPLLYAFMVIALVITMDRFSAVAQMRSGRVNTFLEGLPLLMVEEGQVLQEALRKAGIRHDELLGLLRAQGVEHLGEVRHALLERSGEISVFRAKDAPEGPSTWPDRLQETGGAAG